MSFIKLPNQILNSSKFTKLPATAQMLLIRLMQYSDHKFKPVWPAINTLAEKSGMAENTVRKSLKLLVLAGLIIVNQRNHNSHLIEFTKICTPAKIEEGGSKFEESGVQNLHPNKKHIINYKQQTHVVVSSWEDCSREISELAQKHGLSAPKIAQIAKNSNANLDKLKVLLLALKSQKNIKNPYGFLVAALKNNWEFPQIVTKLQTIEDNRRFQEKIKKAKPQHTPSNGLGFREMFLKQGLPEINTD